MVKYNINVDWFEVMLLGRFVTPEDAPAVVDNFAGKIRFVKDKSGTKHFRFKYDVYLSEKHFGHILCCPRNEHIMAGNFISFKLQNNVLYELEWVERCDALFKAMNWTVKNNTRLDIALDGYGFMDIFSKCVRGEVRKIGQARPNVYYNSSMKQITGYDLGSKASNKWLTAYNKTKELEVSNKKYIKDFWERTDLQMNQIRTEKGEPVYQDVERLELKLRNEEIKKIEGFDWRRLDDFEYLASIMRTSFVKFFEFIEPSKDSNTTRAKRLKFIDWASIGGVRLEKMSTRKSNEVYGLKVCCKQLYWLYLQTKEKQYVFNARNIALNINCADWYIKKIAHWEYQFAQMYGKNKDGEVKFDFMPYYKTYLSNEQTELFAASAETLEFDEVYH